MIKKNIHLVITTGEPAGIGPEVSFFSAQAFLEKFQDAQLTLLGDQSLFTSYRAQLIPTVVSRLHFQHLALKANNTPGVLNPLNASYVLALLDAAIAGCLSSVYDGMVTAPIQKSVISDLGIAFSGHTEYLAKESSTARVVMMLCGEPALKINTKPMRVALVTTHLPLGQVAEAIHFDSVLQTIHIVHKDLQEKFGISRPKIYVAGLNPHAGESGHLGTEELRFITPAIEQARSQGMDVSGPYPADTMFNQANLSVVDAFIAMYHDQGLAPFKLACFGNGVNITLGLPFIRTSVDHGTALAIAGKQIADIGSMYSALELAYQLASHGSSNT